MDRSGGTLIQVRKEIENLISGYYYEGVSENLKVGLGVVVRRRWDIVSRLMRCMPIWSYKWSASNCFILNKNGLWRQNLPFSFFLCFSVL